MTTDQEVKHRLSDVTRVWWSIKVCDISPYLVHAVVDGVTLCGIEMRDFPHFNSEISNIDCRECMRHIDLTSNVQE